MQGKDLGIVLGVAIVAGAASALGAMAIHASNDTSNADLANALATRFDRIETSIARSSEDAKAARADAGELKQRLASMESSLLERRADAVHGASDTVADPQHPTRARRGMKIAKSSSSDGGEMTFQVNGDDMPFTGGVQIIDDADLDGALQQLPEGLQEQIATQMQGLTNGFKLRALPEDQRWAKAKEELGLNDGQVDALKQAVTARDEAMKDAMKPVKASTTSDGGSITIRTMDPEKAATADSAYRSKVDQTLDENQRKSWNEKGWSHAFGRPGGSGVGVSVISAESVIDTKTKEPK